MLFAVLFGFFLGVLAVIAIEGAALFLVIERLSRGKRALEPEEPQVDRYLNAGRSLDLSNKKGTVWVIESEKFPIISTFESPTKASKEQKEKDTVEVLPVKKFAEMKGHSLILSEVDGSQQAVIELLNCQVVAVSASNLPSRKWAKRYPIRLESKHSLVYNGSKTCLLYLDTSWEKESWCKALRLASCNNKERLNWYAQLNEEFHHYLASLNAEYPSFLKPSALSGETIDKSIRVDGSTSKVRDFLKKLKKKASKNGVESKPSSQSSSTRSERKVGDRLHSSHDVTFIDGLTKCSSEGKSSNSLQDLVQPTSPTSSHLGPDAVCNEKFADDEGTLCLNLLFSRLFFDAKRSIVIKDFIKARIQKTLLNMRTPSYVGGVICTGLNLGNLPPYIHKLRLLPLDLNEAWAVEVDVDYSGGILLDVETRLAVCEPELQEDIINTDFGPGPVGEVTSDLLEGIEHYGNQLKSSSAADRMVTSDEGDKIDGLKQSKSSSWASNYVSRWKALKQSLSEQVSQVPISLTIRVASLRGTLRLHIKPPPSDQLWFGFTSMPEIDLNLESSVGDRKITNTHIGLLIANRFKAAIRETLVLPNCESLWIPCMVAEKDDWVPRTAAPFVRGNRDAANAEPSNSLQGSSNEGKSAEADEEETVKDVIHIPESLLPAIAASLSDRVKPRASIRSSIREEVRVPLLKAGGESQESCSDGGVESPRTWTSGPMVASEEQRGMYSDEDSKPKRTGRRARMMDIGRKVGERFEERRRHLEEKSRLIVEKMRDNSKH